MHFLRLRTPPKISFLSLPGNLSVEYHSLGGMIHFSVIKITSFYFFIDNFILNRVEYLLTKGGESEVLQITYQKRDGSIMQKFRNTMLPYSIGDTTSMGWKVLNIEYEYKNKYYPLYEYNMIIQSNKQKFIRKKQIKEIFIREIKTLLYYLIWIIILYYIKIRIGI